MKSALNGLELDLLQAGFDDMGHDLYEKISKMNALFVSHQKEAQLKALAAVTQKMADAIDKVFNQPSSLRRQTLTLDDVALSDGYARLTQKDALPDELDDEPQDSGSLKQQKSSKKQKQKKNKTPTDPYSYENGPVNVDEFLALWAHIKLTPSQRKAIEQLLGNRQRKFSIGFWCKAYSGQRVYAEGALKHLVTQGMIVHLGNDDYAFNFSGSKPTDDADDFLNHLGITLSTRQRQTIRSLYQQQKLKFSLSDWLTACGGDMMEASGSLSHLIIQGVIQERDDGQFGFTQLD